MHSFKKLPSPGPKDDRDKKLTTFKKILHVVTQNTDIPEICDAAHKSIFTPLTQSGTVGSTIGYNATEPAKATLLQWVTPIEIRGEAETAEKESGSKSTCDGKEIRDGKANNRESGGEDSGGEDSGGEDPGSQEPGGEDSGSQEPGGESSGGKELGGEESNDEGVSE